MKKLISTCFIRLEALEVQLAFRRAKLEQPIKTWEDQRLAKYAALLALNQVTGEFAN